MSVITQPRFCCRTEIVVIIYNELIITEPCSIQGISIAWIQDIYSEESEWESDFPCGTWKNSLCWTDVQDIACHWQCVSLNDKQSREKISCESSAVRESTWDWKNSLMLKSSLVVVAPCVAVFPLTANAVTRYMAASLDFHPASRLLWASAKRTCT